MGTGLLQPIHVVVLLVIALLVLGPKRLPEVGRSIGQGLKGFKGAMEGGDDDEPQARRPRVDQAVAADQPAADAPQAPRAPREQA